MNRYHPFDLMITPAGDGVAGSYRAQVINSPSGQGQVHFQLPALLGPWRDRLALVGGALRAMKSYPEAEAAAHEPLTPRAFGEALFSTVFQGAVGDVFQASLASVQQKQEGLRIRLRLNDVPELATLPWEYLFYARQKRFLVLSSATPIVRYLPLPLAEAPLTVEGELRILVLTANVSDAPSLNITAEEERVRAALADLEAAGRAEVTWLRNGTLTALRRALRRGKHHILHFIGHGWFDEQQGEQGLLLADEDGNGHYVSADVLSVTLQNYQTLRLIFLNACEGARQAAGEPFGGVAHQLVQQGLPAVIAMQFPISDQAAIELSREFYGALADGEAVDVALAEARRAIYAQESVMEWGTPVLFLRADDGRLWQTDPDAAQREGRVSERTEISTVHTGGGTYIGGNVTTAGDFVGRDKVVYGDEIKGDKIGGDKVMRDKMAGHRADGDIIIGTVGAGASNVAIGKNITQQNLGAPTTDDKAEIEAQLAQVLATFAHLQSQLDAGQISMIQFQLQLLQGELTKTGAHETPSASTVIQVGDALLDNVPALVPVLRTLFTLSAVVKLLAQAGPTALAWQQRRFY